MGVVLFKYVPNSSLHANAPNYLVINNQKGKGLVTEYIVCMQKDPNQTKKYFEGSDSKYERTSKGLLRT